MGWNVIRYKQLTDQNKQDIIAYFNMHTAADTMAAFNLGSNTLTKILTEYNIKPHSAEEASTIKHFKQDGYDQLSVTELDQIVTVYKKLLSVEQTCTQCNIKEYFLVYLLKVKGIDLVFTKAKASQTMFDEQLKSVNQKAVIDFYLKPNTLKDTAVFFGITKGVVEAILTKNSIPRHNRQIVNILSRNKAEQTNLKQYGVKNVFQAESIKEKSNQTKLHRYNDATYTNRNKAATTCLTKYGATSYLASEFGQDKIKAFNQAKYGTDYAFQAEAFQQNINIKDKRYKTRAERQYTEQNYSQLYLEVALDKNTFTEFSKDKTVNQLMSELSISRDHVYYLLSKYQLINSYKRDYSGTSQAEQEIVDFIGSDLCIRNDRSVLEGREIDIYIPSKHLGIEYNGTHWHSTEMQPDRNYHFNKSKLAEQKGIRLIHIYEYEWNDTRMREKIKLLLNIALGRVGTRIYARHCVVKQISNKEAADLNNKIHLQGHRNAQVTYGLFYNNELVQLMSFSKTRYNRNLKGDNSWEIIRGCPGSNNIVVGGVSRLLAHFIRDQKPNRIFSYCDFNKFDGKSYLAAGMTFTGYTGPDMKWVLPDYTVVNRNPKKHKQLKDLAIAQIFGSGSKKFELVIRS